MSVCSHDLAGIAQQLGAVVRERHAAVAAREHGDAQLLFEILDGGGQVGLRCVQVLGRRVDGLRIPLIAMR